MSAIPRERQHLVVMVLFTVLTVGIARTLGQADVSSTLMMMAGIIACVLAFLNAEVAVYFLIAAMLLSPEFDVGQTGGDATLARPVTLRLDDILILIICGTWFIRSVVYKNVDVLRKTPLNGAIWFYSAACLLSTLIGVLYGNVEPKTGLLFVFKYIEYFLIFWMVVNTAQTTAQVRRFIVVIFAVALIVSIVAIMQIPTGARVTAPFEGKSGEPNTLGGYLIFVFSLLAGIVLVDKRVRRFGIPLLGLLLVALVYTLSRASYLAFIPVVFSLPFLTRRFGTLIGVTIIALLVVAFPAGLLPRAAYSRIDYTFTQQASSEKQVNVLGRRVDTSTSARLMYMSAALDAFMERPIFGWGVTGWHFLDTQYFRSLCETGLIGFSALLFLLYQIFRLAFYARSQLEDEDPVFYGFACGFIAGFIGLLVHGIGSNTFIIVRIMEPFWLCCALMYVLPEILSRKELPV